MIHQKEYIFKVGQSDKLARIHFLKENATRLFKEGNIGKAEKLYLKINKYFKSKDTKGNFLKEDENTTDYRHAADDLDALCAQNLTNLAVVYLKRQKYEEVLDFCDQALKIDHTTVKALYLKARALAAKSNY